MQAIAIAKISQTFKIGIKSDSNPLININKLIMNDSIA